MSRDDLRALGSMREEASRGRRPRLATAIGVVVCLSILAVGAAACGSSAGTPAPAPSVAPAPTAPPPPPPAPTKPVAPTAVAAPASQPAAAAAPVAGAPAAAATGKLMGADLFQMSCAQCHGADRQGNRFTREKQTVFVPSVVWTSLAKNFSAKADRGPVEQQIALAITKGQNEQGADLDKMMPRWSSLAQDQVDSLIAFLKTPAPATAPAPTLPAAASGLMGQQLFETSCAQCHGAKAEGNKFTRKGQTVAVPSIVWSEVGKAYSTDPSRGTPEQQLATAITKGIDEKGADLDKMMPRWSWLTKVQVDSLVQYLRTLP